MDLFGMFRDKLSGTATSRDIVDQYKRLRPVQVRLNNHLAGSLTRDVLDEGGKKLGFLRGGTFVFDDVDQTSVLMDYCIYNVFRNGRNAVEQYCSDNPPDPDSDEMVCLRAMQSATYAMIAVKRVERGVGCQIENFFTEEEQLLIDMGFSASAKAGLVIATRLVNFGNYVATGGAALPLGVINSGDLAKWRNEIRTGVDDPRFDPATLIRACLEKGASSNVRYQEVGKQRRSDAGVFVPSPVHSAGRTNAALNSLVGKSVSNRRCKCGSGKMYKNCCGKRSAPS